VQRQLHFSRQAAVAFVVGGFLAAVAAFALLAVPRAVEQTRQLPSDVPRLVSQLDRAPIAGKIARRERVDERVRSFLDDLPHVLTANRKAIEGAARSAGDSVIAVSWTFLVLVGALLDGPRLAQRTAQVVPAPRRPAAERVGNLVYLAVGRSAAGSAFSALLQGAVVLVIGLAFGVPLSPILAANAAFCAFIPQLGGLLAAVPLVLFGLTQGLATGVAVGLLFLAWMLFNNHVLHPVIVGKAVHLSPLASLIAVLVGASLGGFVGAMVATPTVAVLRVLVMPRTSDETAASDSELLPRIAQ
jgi:predicted PurR-regulated permease PerM